ncbi:MAG TPA: sigma factor-like helix-turn-helix DNA-binding protein [Chitinophagaceae bacterium]|nr:sigma factor-like helix-turn-helix DNA-binding protein [Chitinophagaceae bacterium]
MVDKAKHTQAHAEQSRIVCLPLNKVGLTNRISKAYQQQEQQFERESTPEELADLLNLEIEEVSASINVSSRHVSVDTLLLEGEENTLIDILENSNADKADLKLDHHESLRKEVERSLETLSQRQKEVLRYFFGIGLENSLSLEDIGHKFNLTRERVRQIKDKAINKLKSTHRCRLLKVYLG